MAISLTHYQILKLLKSRGELPQGGRILEIGKANWYGDAPPSVVDAELPNDADGFLVAEAVYLKLCGEFENLRAIDSDPAAVASMNGSVDLDLNILEWPECDRRHNLVINHGTAEHVFNIANVFKVMHDACEVGGLMIHEAPFTGWTSHGFYTLQPTLFYDLARENGYEMVLVATEHLRSRTYQEWPSHEAILEAKYRDQLPDHSMLFVAMRKTKEEPFRIPTQGIYSGAASQFEAAMWSELR
jgi:hypothetical protein